MSKEAMAAWDKYVVRHAVPGNWGRAQDMFVAGYLAGRRTAPVTKGKPNTGSRQALLGDGTDYRTVQDSRYVVALEGVVVAANNLRAVRVAFNQQRSAVNAVEVMATEIALDDALDDVIA